MFFTKCEIQHAHFKIVNLQIRPSLSEKGQGPSKTRVSFCAQHEHYQTTEQESILIL